MLRYNREFLLSEYEQNSHIRIKELKLNHIVKNLSEYKQPLYELHPENDIILCEPFFLALTNNRHIKELKIQSPLSVRQLKALHALLEDNRTLEKISYNGKTLPLHDRKLSTDEQFISNCLLSNSKMAGLKNHPFFEVDAVEIIIDDPRLLLYTEYCKAIIAHPTAIKLKINALLTQTQLNRLTMIIRKNLRIAAIFIFKEDAIASWRKQDGGIVGFPPHGYSSKRAAVSEDVRQLIISLSFNESVAEVQAGNKDLLELPSDCSELQAEAILSCLHLPARSLTLVTSEINESLFNRIPSEGALQVLQFTRQLETKEYDPIAALAVKNSSILDITHNAYSNSNYQSIVDNYPYKWEAIPNELMVNRFLSDIQNSRDRSRLDCKKLTFSAAKARLFAQRLEQHSRLVDIRFENVRIREDELFSILTVLERNGSSLRSFCLIDTPLSSRNFQKLLHLLKLAPCFSQLHLQNTGLSDMEIRALAEWLPTNPPLSILNLHGNKISNQGINTLCHALETNRRVSSLSLGGNPFDTTALPAITRLFAGNSFIARFSMLSSCMEEHDIKPFIEELKKINFSIVHLEISHHTKKNEYRKGGYHGELVTTPYTKKFMDMIGNFTTQNSKKRDQLFTHVMRGEITQINTMFDKKVSPLSTDSSGDTALHVALAQTPLNMPLVVCLIQRGSHTLLMNQRGIAPIDLLAQDSSPELCQLLRNPQGYFAEQQAAPPIEPQPKKQKGLPAVAPKGNSLMDRFVTVQKRAPPEPPASPATVAASPVQSIQKVVAQSPVKSLPVLANSYDVAYFATIHNNQRLLIQCLPQINPLHVYPDGNNLWHLALSNGAIDCLHILYAHKEAAETKNLFLQLPLHLACLHIDVMSSLEALDLVISAHSDLVNSRDAFAQTPLFCLTGGFNTYNYNAHSDRLRAEATRMLLHYNADPNSTLDDLNNLRSQVSILQKATSRGLYRLAKVLMTSTRCNLLHADAEGWSVLHYAVFFGQLEILARLLIQPQVNLDHTNIAGKTARQMARDNEFSAEVRNIPLIKERIEALFEARSRQRLFSPATEVHWVKNLTLRFGSRFGRNHDLVHSFNEEHASLQNAVRSQLHNAGNLLSASLTFVVSKGAHQPGADLSRVAIKVNITFTPKFHATQAWQSETSIEKSDSTSYFKKFKRSPDALNRILERFEAAPEDIRNTAVDNVNQDGRPLSKMGIQRLFDSSHPTADDYDFEKHFHHSEGALFDHLQQPEIIEQILNALRADSQFSPHCKIYAVVLNAFSKNYLCPDCMVATMGFQNTQEGAFFKILKQRLRDLDCVLPTKSNLRAVTFFSAQQNYKQPRKSADEHSEVVIDVRAYPNNKILCQDVTAIQSSSTVFMSRKN